MIHSDPSRKKTYVSLAFVAELDAVAADEIDEPEMSGALVLPDPVGKTASNREEMKGVELFLPPEEEEDVSAGSLELEGAVMRSVRVGEVATGIVAVAERLWESTSHLAMVSTAHEKRKRVGTRTHQLESTPA